MKRIAIFCDGTWNSADAPFPTSIRRFYLSLPTAGPDGTAQVKHYIPGVGTAVASRFPGDAWLNKYLGGAFGYGLDRNILSAYRALAESYAPGDAVYLFGFSRGAYTARSLAGLIRNAGLPTAANIDRAGAAMRLYRARRPGESADRPQALAFRADVSPHLVTSEAEAEWRRRNGKPDAPLLTFAYMGVLDTVGALGVPRSFGWLGRLSGRHYEFHDLELAPNVTAARHAVSIDERRRNYAPSLWTNVPELNAIVPGAPYREDWFPGPHGTLGGGGRYRGLSSAPFAWIAAGAEAAGLTIDRRYIAAIAATVDPAGYLVNTVRRPGLLARLLSSATRDRTGPDHPEEIAPVAVARWNTPGIPEERGGRYRPAPLGRHADWLDAKGAAGPVPGMPDGASPDPAPSRPPMA